MEAPAVIIKTEKPDSSYDHHIPLGNDQNTTKDDRCTQSLTSVGTLNNSNANLSVAKTKSERTLNTVKFLFSSLDVSSGSRSHELPDFDTFPSQEKTGRHTETICQKTNHVANDSNGLYKKKNRNESIVDYNKYESLLIKAKIANRISRKYRFRAHSTRLTKSMVKLQSNESSPKGVRHITCEACGETLAHRCNYNKETENIPIVIVGDGTDPVVKKDNDAANISVKDVSASSYFDNKVYNFECSVCDEVFSDKKQRQIHLKTHKSPFRCKICGRLYIHMNHLHTHVKLSHAKLLAKKRMEEVGPNVKNEYVVTNGSDRENSSQKLNNDNKFVCAMCDEVFSNRMQRSKHHQTHNAPFICKFCGRHYKRRHNLYEHLRNAHVVGRSQWRSQLPEMVNSSGGYYCTMCDGQFVDKSTRNAHHMIHEPPFCCKVCGRQYKKRNSLYEHFRRSHVEAGKIKDWSWSKVIKTEVLKESDCFHCALCDGTFIDKCTRKTHNQTHIPPFRCKICDKEYKSISNVYEHFRKTHVKEGEKLDMADSNYEVISDLPVETGKVRDWSWSRVLETEVLNSSDCFHCAMCDGTFIDKCTRKTHNQTHMPPFRCKICDREYNSMNNVYEHFRKTHVKEGEKLDMPDSKYEEISEDTLNEGDSFECAICNATFSSKSARNAHLLIHEPPFRCKTCHREFKHRYQVHEHMKIYCAGKKNLNEPRTMDDINKGSADGTAGSVTDFKTEAMDNFSDCEDVDMEDADTTNNSIQTFDSSHLSTSNTSSAFLETITKSDCETLNDIVSNDSFKIGTSTTVQCTKTKSGCETSNDDNSITQAVTNASCMIDTSTFQGTKTTDDCQALNSVIEYADTVPSHYIFNTSSTFQDAITKGNSETLNSHFGCTDTVANRSCVINTFSTLLSTKGESETLNDVNGGHNTVANDTQMIDSANNSKAKQDGQLDLNDCRDHVCTNATTDNSNGPRIEATLGSVNSFKTDTRDNASDCDDMYSVSTTSYTDDTCDMSQFIRAITMDTSSSRVKDTITKSDSEPTSQDTIAKSDCETLIEVGKFTDAVSQDSCISLNDGFESEDTKVDNNSFESKDTKVDNHNFNVSTRISESGKISGTEDDCFECGICEEVFCDKKDRNNHTETHEPPFRCKICGREYKYARGIHHHIKISHVIKSKASNALDDSMAFECGVCNELFHDKRQRNTHTLTHEPPFCCKVCGNKYSDKDQFYYHFKHSHHSKNNESRTSICTLENGKGFVCTMCDMVFPDTNQRTKHHQTHDPPFCCKICGRQYKRLPTLYEHIRKSHVTTGMSNTSLNQNGSFDCPMCDETFIDKSARDVHRLNHKPPFCCKICGRKYDRRRLHLYAHFRSKHETKPEDRKRFMCRFCERSFLDKKNLNNHESLHEMEKTNKCRFCDLKFSDAPELGKHEQEEHHDELRNEQVNGPPFKCSICDREFAFHTSLEKHIAIHLGQSTNHKCWLCNKTFNSEKKLNFHFRKEHPDEQPFKCRHCDRGFSRTSTLKAHELSHTGAPPFTCDVCNKGFYIKYTLKIHKQTHLEGIEGKPHQCAQCGLHFATSHVLKLHQIRRHKPDMKRRFGCTICNKRFKTRSDMTCHMGTHSNFKRFQCNQCGDRFTTRKALEFHEQGHAGLKPHKCRFCEKRFLRISSCREHERVHTGEKPYKCIHCGQGFRLRTRKLQHERIHTGERPYPCNFCDKRFNRDYDRKIHERLHTGEKPYQCNDCDMAFSSMAGVHAHRRNKHTEEDEV